MNSVGSGEPVVLLHCLGCDRHVYTRLITDLAKSFNVISYDLRGHGEAIDVGNLAPNLETYADQLDAVLESYGIRRAHLVGQSLGGMAILQYLCQRPRWRGTAVVLEVVGYTDESWRERYAERSMTVLREGMSAVAAPVAARSIGMSTRARYPSIEADYVAQLMSVDPTAYAWACRSLQSFDLRSALQKVATPILFAAGDEDNITTIGHARELAGLVPHGAATTIKRCGHLPCLERPIEMARVLRQWIRTHPISDND